MKIVNGKVRFTVAEAAKFFNKSAQWIHWAERENWWVKYDGTPIEFDRTDKGWRLISAQNIKDMSLSLVNRGSIDVARMEEINASVDNILDL